MFGEVPQFTGCSVQHRQRTLAHAQRRYYRICDTLVVAFARAELIHHQLDEVGLVAVQLLHVVQAQELTVYPDLGVALPAHLLEELTVMALAAAHQGCQQQAFASGIVAHYQVHYLGVGVTHQLAACHGRISRGGLCEEQTQEIGDFGDGAHRAPGIVAGGFLLDGDDGTQAVHALHFGLFEYAHEVLGVGRKGIHVAALAFGVDGVEGEGTLAAAAEAGNHRELPAGDVHIDSLQVVSPGSANFYVLLFSHWNLTNVRK